MIKLILQSYSLWRLAISPTVWALHLLACYILAAIWCAKLGRDVELMPVRWAIAGLTFLALLPIGWQILKGYQDHKSGDSSPPHDDDTPEDQERFLGFANLLISALSAIAVIFVAYTAFVFRSCH